MCKRIPENCPWCGKPGSITSHKQPIDFQTLVRLQDLYSVHCVNVDCSVYVQTSRYSSIEKAIDVWDSWVKAPS